MCNRLYQFKIYVRYLLSKKLDVYIRFVKFLGNIDVLKFVFGECIGNVCNYGANVIQGKARFSSSFPLVSILDSHFPLCRFRSLFPCTKSSFHYTEIKKNSILLWYHCCCEKLDFFRYLLQVFIQNVSYTKVTDFSLYKL